MWQSLQVTDILHNYVSFCAGEKERCVNLEATTGHDCMWESVCEREGTFWSNTIRQVSGRNKTNESSSTDFLKQISQYFVLT